MPRCKFVHNLPCEQVSDRIAELKAENAKLKEHVRWLKKGDVLHVITDQELADQLKHEREMRASITALDDENAKLRELLADTLIDPRDYCAKYGIDYDGWDSANDDIDRRLQELGIEVEK